MNISKAIAILKEHLVWCDPIKEVDTYNALKLGIEALERCQELKKYTVQANYMPLPGETKD